MELKIVTEKLEERYLLQLKGEIDVYTAPQLKRELLPLVESGSEVIVNLAQVEYMDSIGLGVFMGAFKTAIKHNGKLKLCHATPRIARLFNITGLAEVMDVLQEERF